MWISFIGTAAEMTKSTFWPPSSPPATLSQWQLDRMNNQVHEDMSQQENSSKQLSNLQSLSTLSLNGMEDDAEGGVLQFRTHFANSLELIEKTLIFLKKIGYNWHPWLFVSLTN